MSDKLEAAPGVPAFREHNFNKKFFTPGKIVLKGQRFGEMMKVAYKNQEQPYLYPVRKNDEGR